jgi:hypothetical protein
LPDHAKPTTQPTSQPANTQAIPSEPTEGSTTAPSSQPATQASTQPAAPPPPKWEIAGEPRKPANESDVDALLSQLAPLRVEKFVETAPSTTQPSDQYTLIVTTKSGSYTITITDLSPDKSPLGQYNGLTFEISRMLLDKVTGKFDGSASSSPEPGAMPPGMMQMPGAMP